MNQLFYYSVIYLLSLDNIPSSEGYFVISILTPALVCTSLFFQASNYISIRHFYIDFDICIFSLKIFYLFFRLADFHYSNIKSNDSSLLSLVFRNTEPIQWLYFRCCFHFWIFHLFLFTVSIFLLKLACLSLFMAMTWLWLGLKISHSFTFNLIVSSYLKTTCYKHYIICHFKINSNNSIILFVVFSTFPCNVIMDILMLENKSLSLLFLFASDAKFLSPFYYFHSN